MKGVGKTEFTKKSLKSKFIAPPHEHNVWCYAKCQQDFIILDHLMDEVWKSIEITHLFTCGRHDNLSVIYPTQNSFHKNQCALLNSDYMVVLKTPETIYNLLLLQDKYVWTKWSSLCELTKMQHHLRIPTWCFTWKHTLRKGFEWEATFWKIHNIYI